MRLANVAAVSEVPIDVVKVMQYRPDFFGGPYADLLHDVMRGTSDWSAGERELFAAFTSRLNLCPF
jgi:hypothetical protein